MANRIQISIEGGVNRGLPRSYGRWCFVVAVLAAFPVLFGVEDEWWCRTAILIVFGLFALASVRLMRGRDTSGEQSTSPSGAARFARICCLVGVVLLLLDYGYVRFTATPSARLDPVMKVMAWTGLGLLLVWQCLFLFGRNGEFRRSE